jgi:DNA-binding MarR family transcriptional regulator
MSKRYPIILFLTVFSSAFTIYTLLLLIYPASTASTFASKSTTLTNGYALPVMGLQSVSFPLSLSVAGWLLTGYELFAEKRKQISHILKTRISGGRDRWNVYNIFKGKGGARRLTIMESLNVPRQRNEVAKLTNTDWKEVDRNIRILEAANLVRLRTAKTAFPFYELTEQGEELLEIISTEVES